MAVETTRGAVGIEQQDWRRAGIDAAAWAAMTEKMQGAQLWSLLLGVAEARAAARQPVDLLRQWRQDRFVAPCAVDQRTLLALDQTLLRVAADYEAIELAPLTPLGTCVAVAPGSQNRIVSTMRGSEVVSDPTNVLALICAERLRANPQAEVRLATSHRCVRAQMPPKRSGYAAHFRLFCLASAAHERKDQAFTVDALAAHIDLHWRALDALEAQGYAFHRRALRLLATPERAHLAQRIAEQLGAVHPAMTLTQMPLQSAYYHGLRFMIDVQPAEGAAIPLIDGGAFDWLQRLADHRKLAFIASGMGSQLAAMLFGPGAV